MPRTYTLPAGFTVTAHSGAFGTPDNTLEFVERALLGPCDILEMDVTFRPSGTPVIIHKDAPAETEGVLLAEAFKRIKAHPSVKMNLDLKNISNLPALDALLKEYGLTDRAFYTGVGADWAPEVQKHSAVPYYLNVSVSCAEKRSLNAARALADRLAATGAVGLNVHYTDCSGTVVHAMHEKGLPVSLWTANSAAAMRRCLALGVDNITTRKPDQLAAMVNEQ